MTRLPICSLLLMLGLAALASCGETTGDLTSVARTSQSTLNAENDVYGLVVRYHEAMTRAEEYRPLVAAQEAELQALQESLRSLRTATGEIAVEVDTLSKDKAEKTALRDGLAAEVGKLEEEARALLAKRSAAKDAEAALKAELTSMETELEAISARSSSESERIQALRNEAEAASARRAELERDLDSASADSAELEARIRALRLRAEAVRPAMAPAEALIEELERRLREMEGR